MISHLKALIFRWSSLILFSCLLSSYLEYSRVLKEHLHILLNLNCISFSYQLCAFTATLLLLLLLLLTSISSLISLESRTTGWVDGWIVIVACANIHDVSSHSEFHLYRDKLLTEGEEEHPAEELALQEDGELNCKVKLSVYPVSQGRKWTICKDSCLNSCATRGMRWGRSTASRATSGRENINISSVPRNIPRLFVFSCSRLLN